MQTNMLGKILYDCSKVKSVQIMIIKQSIDILADAMSMTALVAPLSID